MMYRATAACQTNLLTAAKAWGAALAWQEERGLAPADTFRIRPHVALLGRPLKRHYKRIFAKERNEYLPS